jgi:hypothetical protein
MSAPKSIGLRAAVILAVILPGVAGLPWPESRGSAVDAASNRPEWIKQGVVAASSMESLSFILRRGGQSFDAEREWLADRTEAAMRRFKEHGINLLVLNLHKGAGLKAEASDIEATRKAVELAHAQGIKVVGYVGASIFYETLPSEEPDAKNWIQVDEFGRPIYYTSEQTFRIMACRNNPGYQEFTRKVIRAGINDLHLDGLHFDQMRWHAEPSSCRCRYCTEQFREFIARRYSGSGMRLRFGFERLDGIIPPPFGLTEPPVRLPELRNPLMQEWALFRSESLARRFREIETYIHELNPSAFFQGNPTMHLDTNVGFIYGIDHAQLLKIGAMLWCEDANQAAWTRDGRLVSKIRSYKALRTMGNSLLAWQDFPSYRGSAELRAAEALAFGDRNLGVVAGSDIGYSAPRPALQPIIDFFWSRAKVLSETVEIADAAVLRSFSSIEFNPAQGNVSTTLFEQSLIQANVPFAIIFDDQLRDLRRYKVLVLADQDALSNDQISLIRGFVEAGGGLVATGDTSLMRRNFGKGRVVYLPRVEPSIAPPPPQMNYSFGNQYWKLPVNHAEMVAAVRWAAGGHLSIEVVAPPSVVVELAHQPSTKSVLIHLLNYDIDKPAESVRVNYRVPAGSRLREVLQDDPEMKSPQPLHFELQANVASFVIPRIRLYRLALLRLE